MCEIVFRGTTPLKHLVVAFEYGTCYDSAYENLQLSTIAPVAVWYVDISLLDQIRTFWLNTPEIPPINKEHPRFGMLIEDLLAMGRQPITFDWLCCNDYTLPTFDHFGVMGFVHDVCAKGHLCMFSDWSLKALIKHWDQAALEGPCPFRLECEYPLSREVRMQFDSKILCVCPIEQLRRVGQMAPLKEDLNHAMVMTRSHTISYVLKERNDIERSCAFKLQVLTTVVESNRSELCHVLLTYPRTGGAILLSKCHWCELQSIEIDEQRLRQVLEESCGAQVAVDFEQEWNSQPNDETTNVVMQRCARIVLSESSLSIYSPSL